MTKRAFLVGVNVYPAPITSLKGCVNDVQQMKAVLEGYYGFEPQEIRLLVDEAATGEAILTGLDWLVAGVQAGDVLVFHYSGHGSHVADDGGDEFDCRDEILLPHDHDWENPLRDDHLKAKFDAVPAGANLTFISDSCHSGSVNRLATANEVPRSVFVPDEIQRQIAVKVAHRDAEFQAFLQQRVREMTRDLSVAEVGAQMQEFLATALDQFKTNRYQFVNTQENNILLAACQDTQTSVETLVTGQWRGALTYNLVQAITGAGGALTYQALITQASDGMLQHQQVPQLECPEDLRSLPIFSPFAG
jgi:hypothetical protein